MTVSRELAASITRAVIDRIDGDGLCNSENIGDAVFRELAVDAAKPVLTGGAQRGDVRHAALTLYALLKTNPEFLFGAPHLLHVALTALRIAVDAEQGR